MKILVTLCRILVSGLFIFSGGIKLNDPLGFSYKLQEYFSAAVLDLEFLIPYALVLAICIVVFEIVLGIALLLGYLPKFTIWSLLGMIVFFTFLTFYSAYFNKVTDCGCFGDAIPLTPWESFAKDVVLFFLILILFVGQKHISPLIHKSINPWIVFSSTLLCFAFGYYVLTHLPLIDFRAYAVGTNIPEGMVIPADAPKARYAYKWKFKVDGAEKIITTQGAYPKSKGTYMGVETKQIAAGYEPPIHDFSIEKNNKDFTTFFLGQKRLLLVVMYNLSKSEIEGVHQIKSHLRQAKQAGYSVIGLTASSAAAIKNFRTKHQFTLDFYTTDETALKTIIRSNPGIVTLDKGTIISKLHWHDVEKMEMYLKK